MAAPMTFVLHLSAREKSGCSLRYLCCLLFNTFFYFCHGASYTPLNALNPPSTGMTWPVTNPDASSLSSHSNVPSKSSGFPK